jgi:hypothetical protein
MIWNLIGRAKRTWQLFTSSKPGDRFQVRYYRRQQSTPGRFSMILNFVVGCILVIFSAFFGWAPGPGLLTFLIGLALIGGEFLTIARFLDWSEVTSRKLAHLVAVVWKSSTAGKAFVVFVALVLVVAFGYVIYSIVFR